jgi:hypothetical protein
MPKGRAVIGAEIVCEINRDISRTVLPSWLASGPSRFNASEHGKLKADEWKTVILVRLVVTLARVWSFRGPRHKILLDHFMHLVVALIIAGGNTVDKTKAKFYKKAYGAYLDGIVEHYPTAKVKPNTHLAYHVGDLLDGWGPTHAWRCYVFERYNGILQNFQTNMRFGMLILFLSQNKKYLTSF